MKIAKDDEDRFPKGSKKQIWENTMKSTEKSQKAKRFRSFLCCRRPLFLCPTSHEVGPGHGHEHMLKQDVSL